MDDNANVAATMAEENVEDATGIPSQPSELPMSMTASMIMTNLPQDITRALEEIESIDNFKVPVRFSPLPSAPSLERRVFKVSASHRFEAVVKFLRRQLRLAEHEALFCYVNSVFAPGLDEGVGNLFRCFKTDNQLNVSYSITPAFG